MHYLSLVNRLRKNILLNKKTKIRIDYLKLQTILASVNQDALSQDKLLKAQTQLNVCQLCKLNNGELKPCSAY